LYREQRRYAEAEPLYKRAVAINEKALGAEHPSVATDLNNLAELYRNQARYADAELLWKRALTIWDKALGSDHPNFGTTLSNLALLYYVQGDWPRAADFYRRSSDVVVRRARRGNDDVGRAVIGNGRSEVEQLSFRFLALVKVANRLASDGRAPWMPAW